MAAYAALVSLMNTLDAMKNHPRLSISFDKFEIESLGEKLDFLLDFIETYNSHGGGINAEDLESQIASAAHKAEDVIESHLADQILSGFSLDHGPETSSEEADKSSPEKVVLAGSTSKSPSFLLDQLKQIEDMTKNAIITAEEEVNESHPEKVILAGSTTKSHNFLLDQLKQIKYMTKVAMKAVEEEVDKSRPEEVTLAEFIEEVDSIKEKLIELKKERGIEDQRPRSPIPAASSRTLTTGRTTVVGFDREADMILDWLTGHRRYREILIITGMVGIGKTTLARYVYENSLVVQHFEVCAWVTISHDYNVREILFKTLSGLVKSTSILDEKTEVELGKILHKILVNKRYLIILDDIWSIKAMGKISLFFPENKNRSRIVVTTRQVGLSDHPFGFAVNFLNDDDSWSLFCEKAFAHEDCPSELETIGRKIVEKCKGLPLLIVMIARHLGKSSRTREYWENMEKKDLSSIFEFRRGQ